MPNATNPTNLEEVQASALASAKAQVANLNSNLTSVFMTGFNNWATSVMAGKIPNTDPPRPPAAFVVGYFNDPTSGPGSMGPYGDMVVKWAFPTPGTEPVCPMPPIPQLPVHTEGMFKIGIAIPGGNGIWFQALQGDNTPDGTTAPGTSQDGVHGLFQKVGFTMGNGWFKKLSEV